MNLENLGQNKSFFSRFWWFAIFMVSLFILTFWVMNIPRQKNENLKVEKFLTQPESRIVIALPFAKEDEADSIVPLGETVYHPDGGHPGIDFGWKNKVSVRASADGTVVDLPDGGKGNGEIGLVLQSRQYYIEYGSLGEYAKDITVGSQVKKGDVIGYPLDRGKGENVSIHWEIKPAYQYSERLCPLTYLDYRDLVRLEQIWAKTQWEYKPQFPNICNGKWKNFNSFTDIDRWEASPEKAIIDQATDAYKKQNYGQEKSEQK